MLKRSRKQEDQDGKKKERGKGETAGTEDEDGEEGEEYADVPDKNVERELSRGFCLIDNVRVGSRSALKVRGLQAWRSPHTSIATVAAQSSTEPCLFVPPWVVLPCSVPR